MVGTIADTNSDFKK